MSELIPRGAYETVGAAAAINARGIYSELGGWSLTQELWTHISEANRYSTDMSRLLDTSGSYIAGLLGTEAARVTSGVSATIVLGIAAFISKGEGEAFAKLPDTTGLHDRVLIQHNHRYIYDRMVSMAGGALHEIGDDAGTAVEDLQRELADPTIGMLVPAHLDGRDGTLPLATVVEMTRAHGVPVLVDAAYTVFPLEEMRMRAQQADLVSFSAKYWGGPNSGGVVTGTSEQIDAIARLDFTGYEAARHHSLGRPFKLDRWTVLGTALSLRDWLGADHDERFNTYAKHLRRISSHLPAWCDAQHMNFTMEGDVVPGPPVNCLTFEVPDAAAAIEFEKGLEADDPIVLVHRRGSTIVVDVECLHDDEVDVLGERLADQLQRVGP